MKTRTAWLLILPVVCLFLVFLVLPLVFLTYQSLFEQVAPGVTGADLTLRNYVDALQSTVFRSTLWRTLSVSIVVTIITAIVSYPVAYFMARSPHRFRVTLVYMAVIAPLFISVVVRNYGWIVILQRNGALNYLLSLVGLPKQSLLYQTPAVLIGMVHVLLPIMTLPLWASLQKIDRDLDSAALSLGASRISVFRGITLPLSIPGIAAGSILVFAATMAGYVTPLLLGGPKDGFFIAVMVTSAALFDAEQAAAAALGVMFVLIMLPIIWIHRQAEHSLGRYGNE